MSDTDYDTTGWCDRGEHGSCSGDLRAASGFHWWCACPCHPEPTPSPMAPPADADAALATWRVARQEATP